MPRKKYSDEIKKFAIELLEMGYSEREAVTIIKNENGIKVTDSTILAWFHASRRDFVRGQAINPRLKADADKKDKLMHDIKEQAKPGLTLKYEVFTADDNGTVKRFTKESKIVGIYANFIKTINECVIYADAVEVI